MNDMQITSVILGFSIIALGFLGCKIYKEKSKHDKERIERMQKDIEKLKNKVGS